jgi:hypothetical protein
MPYWSESARRNAGELAKLFARDETFVLRIVRARKATFYLAYCGGLIDNAFVSRFIIAPLEGVRGAVTPEDVMERILSAHFPKLTCSLPEIEEGITAGDTAVFVGGGAVLLSTQGFSVRGPTEPNGERV